MTIQWVSLINNMAITYRDFGRILFPVYPIPNFKDHSMWSDKDGLLRINDQIVDDKNQDGYTIGKRRLQSPFKNLYPLKTCANDFVSVLKCNNSFFIDNRGLLFSYEKTKFVPLKYKKITKITRKDDFGSLLSIDNSKESFKIPRPPPEEMEWVGLLYLFDLPWLPYEYSENRKKDTRRKI